MKESDNTKNLGSIVICHAAGGPLLQVVWPDHVKLLQMVRPAATGPPMKLTS